MSINAKNTMIRLLVTDEIPDGMGGLKPNPANPSGWKPVANVWAEIRKPNVATAEKTGTIISELMHKMQIWRRADVRMGWRVLYGGRMLEVMHAYDYEKTDTMLVCRDVIR